MNFKVKNRDTLSRLGVLTNDKKQIQTPNLMYIKTSRFNTPDFAEIIYSNKDVKSDKILIYNKENILRNNNFYEGKSYFKEINNIQTAIYASQEFSNSKNFVDFIIAKRKTIGNHKAMFIPAIAKPANLSLLVYLGCDLFDNSQAIISARNDTMLFSDGEKKIDDLDELPCSCPVCNKIRKVEKLGFNEIFQHNNYIFFDEIRNIRNSIKNHNLRNLVENRIKSSPNLVQILRHLDNYHYDYLEENTPTNDNNIIYANTKDSMNRSEIKRFQYRIINRYIKPESTKILLLLPCSAKKPYSFSKSHKFFLNSINKIANKNIIHQMIITSPLGLVPRELELTYPAANYDIPVTGFWDEDEKKMIRELLKKYLKINKYEHIIIHLPEEISCFIKDLFEKPIITCNDKPRSDESLKNLELRLKEITDGYVKINTEKRLLENMKSIASYQFGRKTAEKLIKKCKLKGKYPYQKLFFDKKQIAMLTKDRGIFSLTLDGGKKIFNESVYNVEIFDDFKLAGSVFAPGVKKADKEIRIGDEVLVVQNKKLVGVGVAEMNYFDMLESKYGEAVKIRHKI